MKNKLILILILSLVLAGSLLGCNSPKILQGEAKNAALALAAPVSDNLLAGITQADYTVFSRDFDEAMLKGIPESGFKDMLAMFSTKLGAYQTSEITAVTQDEKFTTVYYKLGYEKDSAVTMRVVVTTGEPHKVTGLWFDSQELRKK